MALQYGMSLPLLCDKEDDSLKTYLGDDFFFSDSQSFDSLSPTFAGDDLVDRLVNQLEAQGGSESVQQDQFENKGFGLVDTDSSLISLCNQDAFLRLLDDLDFDGENRVDSQIPPMWTNQSKVPDVMVVDEHDYAKGAFPRVSVSASYSSVEDSCQSSSEEQSPTSYERQITSNSSCSSAVFEYSPPAVDTELIFDISDTEAQPIQKQRRTNRALPYPKAGQVYNTGSSMKKRYPPLILTEEERQLCEKEHIHLPENYPLTKEEERKLRAVRRKIRNKASAQLSRKKKQEYVEALEHRVGQCSEQNEKLKQHVQTLASKNRTLQAELRKIQAALASNGRRTGQTGTCLAVLLLSFALLIAPEYGPFGKRNQTSQPAAANMGGDLSVSMTPGNTRTLLQLQGPAPDYESMKEEENFSSLSRSFQHFYDNESIEFSQPTSAKKRNLILTPPDSDMYSGHGIAWEEPSAKKMKLGDIDEKTRIDLDFYKTPGIAAVKNGSSGGPIYRQPYGGVNKAFRTEGM